MDWQHAIAASSTLGFAFAFAARYIPGIKNRAAPIVGFVTIVITNLTLMWQTFVKNAELAQVYFNGPIFEHHIALAGFGSIFGAILQPIMVIAQPIVLSTAQLWLNRLFHEGAVKPMVKGT